MEAFELLKYRGADQLFECLSGQPKRVFTINELSKVAGLPFTTTWKLVKKFEMAGIVETTLVGKARTVRYKESKFSNLIKNILRMSTSPQRLSLKELKKIIKSKKQIKQAYLFGSLAEGKEKLESDIDLALLIKKRMDLHPLISEMYKKYAVRVVPLIFDSAEEFKDFLKDKKKVRLI